MRTPVDTRTVASGFILLEGLLAVLLFTVGILGMIGMFTVSIKNSSDAQYRTEAAFLADSVIAEMRVADPSSRATTYASPTGTAFVAWKNRVTSATSGLPGAASSVPTIVFSAGNVVTVQINWRANNDAAVHKFVTETSLE